MNECDRCVYGNYDEEYAEIVCCLTLDEDDWARLAGKKNCPYFKNGDDYQLVKKQN